MTTVSSEPATIIRTERGLVIAGTRITLYQLMDYIHAGHSLQITREHFPQITDGQFQAAISYIEANRLQVETEYQIVVKEDEEIRQYWEEKNRELFVQISRLPSPPGQEAAWAKLQAQKARIASQA